MEPTMLPCGDRAFIVQLGDRISASVNKRIIRLAEVLEHAALPGLEELVPTYRSLLLRYDPERVRGTQLAQQVLTLCAELQDGTTSDRLVVVPVVYGGQVGQDLAELAKAKNLSEAEVVALHTQAEYRVYMIGFAPGFAYLGGLPEALHMPRLLQPRQLVREGGIGIGGQQASVNSVTGPSGWRFIGWTPLRAFDPGRAEPFLLRAGDRVRFRSVSPEEGAELARRVASGETLIEAMT